MIMSLTGYVCTFIGSRLALGQHDNTFTVKIYLQQSILRNIIDNLFLFLSYGVTIINEPNLSRSCDAYDTNSLANCSHIAITLERKWQLLMQCVRKKIIKMPRFGFQKTNPNHAVTSVEDQTSKSIIWINTCGSR